jgi:hypothetical protein
VPPLCQTGDVVGHVSGGIAPIVLRRVGGERVEGEEEERKAELVRIAPLQGVNDAYSAPDAAWEDWLIV